MTMYDLVCYECDSQLLIQIKDDDTEQLFHCPFCGSEEIELIEVNQDE